MSFERVVLSNLIFSDEFGRKAIPFLKQEYFQEYSDKVIFGIIDDYIKKYNSFPSIEALAIDLSNKDGLSEDVFKEAKEIISTLSYDPNTSLEWILDKTEKFCQDKALYLAIMQSIKIMDEKNGSISKGSIPSILTDALAVSFDTHIGHDFLADSNERYEFYHRKEKRVQIGRAHV